MREIVHLYSGGTDSTYAAVFLADIYDRIHLITYDRVGFRNTANAKVYVEKLRNKFGIEKFTHDFINIDREFKILCYSDYFKDLFRFGFQLLGNCGLCKLAMHWHTIRYCLDNNLNNVSCGSGKEMKFDPSQNNEIILEMRALYQEFGIHYFTPCFDTEPSAREKMLFELGISDKCAVKWTEDTWRLQPLCSQEYLHIIFLQYACGCSIEEIRKHDYLPLKQFGYHSNMEKFHRHKRNQVKKFILKYIEDKKLLS